MFAFLPTRPIQKGTFLKEKKNLLPQESNYFLLLWIPFQKGRNNFDRVVSLENVPIPFNDVCNTLYAAKDRGETFLARSSLDI